MPKRPAKEPEKDKDPAFEESLAELERIVDAMEQDQLPLEALVESYAKGSRLLARCEAVLDAARQRLEVLTLAAPQAGTIPAAGPDESPEAGGFEPADAPDADDPAEAGDDDDDDEIRLF